MLLAGIALTASGLAFEHVDAARAVAPLSLLALAYLAICGSALAFYLNHWLLQRITSGAMGLSALIIPVIAVAVGALAGGEHLTGRDALGALLVFAGIWIALGRPLPQLPAVSLSPAGSRITPTGAPGD
jgi:drug/metabolite transporter (DMT)-like permease